MDAIYPIFWMDAIHYKVMEDNNQAVSRSVYNFLAFDRDGWGDLVGMYIVKSDGANFWLCVLNDLQNRYIKDILISCVDGLKGFSVAINSI